MIHALTSSPQHCWHTLDQALGLQDGSDTAFHKVLAPTIPSIFLQTTACNSSLKGSLNSVLTETVKH